MSFRRSIALMACVSVASTSCQVITEMMPVSVTPVETPTAAPIVTKTPAPTDDPGNVGNVTPPPVKTKTPKPGDPDSNPTNVPGCPKSWPPSCQPVAIVGIVTFWVMCGSSIVPNSKYATSAPAACQVKLDCTPKDGSRVPTQSNDPVWTWGMGSSSYWVGWQGGPFNPTVHGEGAKGQFSTYATVDGVRSNDIVFYFQ